MNKQITRRLKAFIGDIKKARGHKSSFFVHNDKDIPEILIYDVVDDWWGISPTDIVDALSQIDAPRINIRINSPGGIVTDGIAIMTALASHSAEIHTYNDGLAASIASVIMMAGAKTYMSEGAWFMIHDPWGITIGNSEDMRESAGLLDQFAEQIAELYAKRTTHRDGLDKDEILKAMSEETWYTTEQARESGFIDEIVDVVPTQAQFTGSVFSFENAPDLLAEQLNAAQQSTKLSKATVRTLLRDAGASNRDAKLMAAGAVSALGRYKDAEMQELLDVINRAQHTLRGDENVITRN